MEMKTQPDADQPDQNTPVLKKNLGYGGMIMVGGISTVITGAILSLTSTFLGLLVAAAGIISLVLGYLIYKEDSRKKIFSIVTLVILLLLFFLFYSGSLITLGMTLGIFGSVGALTGSRKLAILALSILIVVYVALAYYAFVGTSSQLNSVYYLYQACGAKVNSGIPLNSLNSTCQNLIRNGTHIGSLNIT